MEGFRRWLWHRKSRKSDGTPINTIPRVWLAYPHKRLWARYGSAPVNKYDEWEIRPIRWERQMDSWGLLASAAIFEDGVIWKGRETGQILDAPWRTRERDEKKGRRASVVYLNPLRRDIEYGGRYSDFWHDKRRIPHLILGQPSRFLPKWATHECRGILAYDRQYRDLVNRETNPYFATSLHWRRFWDKEEPKHFISAPHEFRHTLRNRWPSMVKSWCERKGWPCHVPEDTGRWQDVEDATSCRFYVVASTAETLPFDAMIAYARGAMVIAPDVGVFPRIFHKKWLYPVHESGNHSLAWSQVEVREWLYNRLHAEAKKWLM